MTYWQHFPDGRRRREEVVSKVTLFFERRFSAAEEWDVALLRLLLSDTVKFWAAYYNHHAVRCWHIARSSECGCLHAFTYGLGLSIYQQDLSKSTLVQSAITPLAIKTHYDPAQDSLNVLLFILSLPESSQLSLFIYLYVVHVLSSLALY